MWYDTGESICTPRKGRGTDMKNERDVEKMVAQMGLKKSARREVIQYGKGLLDGMHMAYCSVARKMLAEGQGEAAVRRMLGGLVEKAELASILEETES